MDDADLIECSRQIEKRLRDNYGATGRGLGKLVDSVKDKITKTLLMEIVYFASKRNKRVHEGGEIDYNKIQERYQRIIDDLDWLAKIETEYFIFCRKDWRCIDATWECASGTKIILWKCHGAKNQKWYLTRKYGNVFTIKSVNSGKYLDVAGFSKDNFTPIHQWDCNNSENQMWELIGNEDGSYFVKVKHSGKFLSALDDNIDGCGIVQYDWHGANNQRWDLKIAT